MCVASHGCLAAAGPKLRKWYGEGERKQGNKKQSGPGDEEEEPRDAILVTDADSPLGELVLLQLILARCEEELSSSSFMT